MRTIRPTRAALAAALVAAAAATSAGAQTATAATPIRSAALLAESAPRPVARYRLNAPKDVTLPSEVTIADSAGALVASYRFPGEESRRRMLVVVIDSDIVLQDQTPSGTLTLQLYRQNGFTSGAGDVTGRWWLDGHRGDLRGKVQSTVAVR